MRFTTLALVAVALAATATHADIVNCDIPDFENFCTGMPAALESIGKSQQEIDESEQIMENEGGILTARTANDEMGVGELRFQYKYDGGDFDFSFGFCIFDQLSDDAQQAFMVLRDTAGAGNTVAREAARMTFAKACVGNDGSSNFLVFDDDSEDPQPTTSKPFPGINVPTDVVFWLIPNNRLSAFEADMAAFFETPVPDSDANRRPLFSAQFVNYDDKDQFIALRGDLEGDTLTLFVWEDKTRADGLIGNDASDEDFGDLVFGVNAVIDAVAVEDFYCDPENGPDDASCASNYAKKTSETNFVSIAWGPLGEREPNCELPL